MKEGNCRVHLFTIAADAITPVQNIIDGCPATRDQITKRLGIYRPTLDLLVYLTCMQLYSHLEHMFTEVLCTTDVRSQWSFLNDSPPTTRTPNSMRFFTTLFVASVAALVASSPVTDTSSSNIVLDTQQMLLGGSGDEDGPCQPYGSLCDWPAGSRGPCCAPLLCRPITIHPSPYLVCS